jgi:regulatory protein YycI of two-component signal transduction system YycFG
VRIHQPSKATRAAACVAPNISAYARKEIMSNDKLNEDAWRELEQSRAIEEGWGLFAVDGSEGCVAIQKIDEDGVFASDEHAVAHVLYHEWKDETILYQQAIINCSEGIPSEAMQVRLVNAQKALAAVYRTNNPDREIAVRDLISNLLHLSDTWDLDPKAEIAAALASYEAECLEVGK